MSNLQGPVAQIRRSMSRWLHLQLTSHLGKDGPPESHCRRRKPWLYVYVAISVGRAYKFEGEIVVFKSAEQLRYEMCGFFMD